MTTTLNGKPQPPATGDLDAVKLSSGQALGVTAAVLLAAAVDALAASGAILYWRTSAPAALPATGVLLAGLVGHAALSLLALAKLGTAPSRSVLLLRLALACWLVLGGAGLSMGARPWPAAAAADPLTMLALAGAAFVGLLAYLRTLEWLADKVGPFAPSRPGGPAVRKAAAALIAFNLLLAAAAGIFGWVMVRRHELAAALLAFLAFGALALYAQWAGVALARISASSVDPQPGQPAQAAVLLSRSLAALLVGLMLVWVTLQRVYGGTWPALLGLLPAVVLLADLLAVWYCHWRLTPFTPPHPMRS